MSAKIKLFEEGSECCGCGACYNACPKSAISFFEDNCGFIFPQIDESKCVSCGLCNKVCPIKNDIEVNKPQKAFAAAFNNEEIKRKSASGGVFAGVAKYILEQGGVVYGAAYGENQYVHHAGIERIEDLWKLQDSKYVQSDIKDTYSSVRNELLGGKLVLFSGTPCQIAGLKLFLRKDYDNLFTIDLICHGVPNYQMFYDGIKSMVGKDEVLQRVSFRDKQNGWGTDGYVLTNKKRYRLDEISSSYYFYFLRSGLYRESCYSCKYASDNRPGDLTIGDYWRIETAHHDYWKKINAEEGISCVLVNTKKGQEIFCAICKDFSIIESTPELVKARNSRLCKTESAPTVRKELMELYRAHGFEAVNEYWKKHETVKLLRLRIKECVRPLYKKITKAMKR